MSNKYDKLAKVLITVKDSNGWEWAGYLSPAMLTELCAFADTLSDLSVLIKEKL